MKDLKSLFNKPFEVSDHSLKHYDEFPEYYVVKKLKDGTERRILKRKAIKAIKERLGGDEKEGL